MKFYSRNIDSCVMDVVCLFVLLLLIKVVLFVLTCCISSMLRFEADASFGGCGQLILSTIEGFLLNSICAGAPL